MDGSTDRENKDSELMMVCWYDTNANDENLHTVQELDFWLLIA